MDIKSFIKARAQKEKQNHYITNIMMASLFALIIVFTLFSGANINLGSIQNDSDTAVVRHSFFKIADAVVSSNMDFDESKDYVDRVNKTLLDQYGILGANYDFGQIGGVAGAGSENIDYHSLDLTDLIAQAKSVMKNDISKINWLKYKFALSNVLASVNSDTHKSSWDGHAAVMLVGQSVFTMLIKLALIIISLAMLAYCIFALVRKKPFTKAKLSLLLLLICFFAQLFFNFALITPDFATVFVAALIILATIAYALIQHMLMQKQHFSKSMFIHNIALLGGALLSFILMIAPLFKVTDLFGGSKDYGWNLIFDMFLGEGAYMTVPLAYFLQTFIISVLLMLHVILNMVLILMLVSKFISADYQHNEKKVFIIMTLALNTVIYALIGGFAASGMLIISTLNLTATLNLGIIIIQPLILAGLVAFEYLYRPVPIKKELIIVDGAPVTSVPVPEEGKTDEQSEQG